MRLVKLFCAFLITLAIFWITPRLNEQRTGIEYYDATAEQFSVDHEAVPLHSSDKDHTINVWLNAPTDTSTSVIKIYYHQSKAEDNKSMTLTRAVGSFDHYQTTLPRLDKGETYSYHLALETADGRQILRLPEQTDQEITVKFEGSPKLIVWASYVGLMFLALLYGILSLFDAIRLKASEFRIQKLSRKVIIATFFLFVGAIVVGCIVSQSRYGYFWGGWPINGNRSQTMIETLLLYWLALTILFKGTIFRFRPEKNIVSQGSAAVLTLLGVLFMITVYLAGDHFAGIPL